MKTFDGSIGGNVSPLKAEGIKSTVLLFVLVVSSVNVFKISSLCNSSTSLSSLLSIWVSL